MKFGKVLQQSTQMSPNAWEPYWADYKLLKKIIKDCAQIKKEEKLQGDRLVKIKIKPSAKEDNDSIRQSQDEMNFFRTLRGEIKKIADFFLKEQAKHTSQVAAIDASFQQLKTEKTQSEQAKTALMKSCVTLYKELLLLENFAVMNFCGISKILKKHDKWTGYATRNKFMHTILMKQPFATYEPLLQMIDRLEHIFMQATGSSIEQHDAQKSSSRRSGDGGGDGAPNSSNPGDSTGSTGHGAGAGGSPAGRNSPERSPTHTPPGASRSSHHHHHHHSSSAASDRYRVNQSEQQRLQNSSPRSEESVTLVRVNALRNDVREIKKMESMSEYDGDGEYEEGMEDDAAFPDDDAEVPPLRFAGRAQEFKEVNGAVLPPLASSMNAAAATAPGNYSDSDAAAIAMLSMKDSAGAGMGAGAGAYAGVGARPAGVSSDGESGAEGCRARSFKRKALSPLNMNGKRKMSVTAILN